MIWFKDEKLVIRNMEDADAQVFTDEEIAQGWNADVAKYRMRMKDQAEGKCVALTAEYDGYPAGYINVYLKREGGPFAETDWPEIVDFGVLQRFRRRGIGTRLMDVAEQIAARYADTVWLGVGLHNGYGSAQRMYVKRGYIPDGSGVWYRGKPCTPYDTVYTNDDDMVLFLSKKLSGSRRSRTETPEASPALTDVILSRRSYRGKYSPESVARADLVTILEAGLAAPSGCNKQTTNLIAVDDPAILQRINAVIDPPVAETAPAMICVLSRRIIAYRDRCFATQDYAAAIENMLLAIAALGYQSCWYEGHITDTDRICDRIAKILNVPEGYELVCILPVGKALSEVAAPKKKAFSERAWFNGFEKND